MNDLRKSFLELLVLGSIMVSNNSFAEEKKESIWSKASLCRKYGFYCDDIKKTKTNSNNYISIKYNKNNKNNKLDYLFNTRLHSGKFSERIKNLSKENCGNVNCVDFIYETSLKYGIDCNLVYSIGYHESGFDNELVSRKGAIGIMQILPSTARSECGMNYRDLKNPRKNIECGIKYLSHLRNNHIRNFNYPVDYQLMGMYFAGPNAVKRDKRYGFNFLNRKKMPRTNKYLKNVSYIYNRLRFEEGLLTSSK